MIEYLDKSHVLQEVYRTDAHTCDVQTGTCFQVGYQLFAFFRQDKVDFVILDIFLLLSSNFLFLPIIFVIVGVFGFDNYIKRGII